MAQLYVNKYKVQKSEKSYCEDTRRQCHPVADPENMKGVGRQCISPVAIYCKYTQQTFIQEKTAYRKKIEANRGGGALTTAAFESATDVMPMLISPRRLRVQLTIDRIDVTIIV